MTISMIVAMGTDGLIGEGLRLPWRLPGDLRRFRALTMGKPIVMGRRTFESLGGPLEGRTNLVLTRNPAYRADGCIVRHSLRDAVRHAEEIIEGMRGEIVVIGGAEVFRQAAPFARRFYKTTVEGSFEGDTFFPSDAIDPADWERTFEEHHPAIDRNPFAHTFETFERVRSPLEF